MRRRTHSRMRSNASKSVEKVLRAAEQKRYAAAGAFHTAGGIVYSYDMPIADLRGDLITDFRILDKKRSPSATTSKHIGYLLREYPRAQVVGDLGMVPNQSSDLVGYLTAAKSSSRPGRDIILTDFHGKPMGWVLYEKLGGYVLADGYEQTTAVVLESTVPVDLGDDEDGEPVEEYRYAGGYWLGPDAGDLFRGEVADGTGDDALQEANELADSLSDYWAQRDQEDREQQEAEMAEEDDEWEDY